MAAGDDPAGLSCPGCGRHCLGMIGAGQAVCGNEDCAVFIYDPEKTPAELMADMNVVDLTGLEDMP